MLDPHNRTNQGRPADNYDGPADGYDGPSSGYGGPSSGYGGPSSGCDPTYLYDGPSRYDRPTREIPGGSSQSR
jgi:hypothetical protein